MARTLVAGFGNVLRGDDGFGVEVVRRLQQEDLGPAVDVMEIGTAGIRLVQQLLDRYERLVIVDAMSRGGEAGSVYVLSVDDVAPAATVDMHTAVPASALAMARSMGALPGFVFMVGCEAGETDELTTELSSGVRAAVDIAVDHVRRLIREFPRE